MERHLIAEKILDRAHIVRTSQRSYLASISDPSHGPEAGGIKRNNAQRQKSATAPLATDNGIRAEHFVQNHEDTKEARDRSNHGVDVNGSAQMACSTKYCERRIKNVAVW